MRAVVAAVGTLVAGSALGCGICVDDKIAVVYDHALVERALAQHHVVVFAEPVGPGLKAPALAALGAAAARSGSIVAGSLRTAAEPAALAFALDPARQSPAAALAGLERDAGIRGVRLSLLRVVR